jgi:hypothetical protein
MVSAEDHKELGSRSPTYKKNALAWAGQAENPPKPRMGIRLAALITIMAVPVWQAPLLRCESSSARTPQFIHTLEASIDSQPCKRGDRSLRRKKTSRLGRSQAEKSAQALWGHSVGLMFAENVPGLGGPGGKPTQASGDIRLAKNTSWNRQRHFELKLPELD